MDQQVNNARSESDTVDPLASNVQSADPPGTNATMSDRYFKSFLARQDRPFGIFDPEVRWAGVTGTIGSVLVLDITIDTATDVPCIAQISSTRT